IVSLKEQGARIDAWGVGTKLVTGWDQPALGGVYKLAALRKPGGDWIPRLKISEQTTKVTVPGVQGVRRYRRADGSLAGDMIYDTACMPPKEATMVDPADSTRRKAFSADQEYEELLVGVMRAGKCVRKMPELSAIRERVLSGLAELDPSTRRFLNPHTYPVGLERSLHDLRRVLVLRLRGVALAETAPSAEAVAKIGATIGKVFEED
ncbi:MAG: nicotinate phosphoribosyltransferase, partial [Coriobacteriia bacterium]|nr:nicotinate phosphoribosyltransferase [Coriobacteriia bacterium]